MARLNFKKSIVDNVSSVVYTDPDFAQYLVDWFSLDFRPGDTFLDPCAGNNAFYDALPEPKERCEIRDGIDFLQYNKKVNWIITNFPWRGSEYTKLAEHAFKLADNVVSLARWDTLLGTKRRHREYLRHGHGLKKVIMLDWERCGFTYHDGTKKPPEGFLLCAAHFQRMHSGSTELMYWWR